MTEHAVRMRALLHGQIVSRALCVVAELGLADELRDGPRTAEELAARVSAHPGAVRRLLRALSAFDVFAADAAAPSGSPRSARRCARTRPARPGRPRCCWAVRSAPRGRGWATPPAPVGRRSPTPSAPASSST